MPVTLTGDVRALVRGDRGMGFVVSLIRDGEEY
jgi:hypothetical protein